MDVRWRIASRVLNAMPFIALRACEGGIQEKQQNASFVFQEMARDLREIAQEHHFPCGDAAGLIQTLGALSVILFGPKFDTPFIEGDPSETIIRFTHCPMLHHAQEKGFSGEDAHLLCGEYVKAVISALNPEFQIVRHDAVCRGHMFCEMVIQKR